MSSASRHTADSTLNEEVNSPLSPRGSMPLSRIGGIAAILVVAVLMTGLLGTVIPSPGLGLRNWVVVLFQINAGVGQVPAEPLRVFNPLDVVVLVLVGLTFASLWPKATRVDRILVVIAAGLPFVGIAVLVVTDQAGWSSVMGAGLVVAVLMLRNHLLARKVVYLGILASTLLLVGDFPTGSAVNPTHRHTPGARVHVADHLVRGNRGGAASVQRAPRRSQGGGYAMTVMGSAAAQIAAGTYITEFRLIG